jgi:hypothetical protein
MRSRKKKKADAQRWREETYWNTIIVLLADALGLCLSLLEGMLVLKLGSHLERLS